MFADAGFKFDHSPKSHGAMEPWRQMACTWVLTLETRAAQAVQGISWHTSFAGEAAAAGADDSKVDGLQRQLRSPRHKKTLLQLKDQCLPCAYSSHSFSANQTEALWPNG